MNRLSLFILAGMLSLANAEQITFTPNFETTESDGNYMRRMYFQCGSKRIYFRPAGRLEVSGTPESVVFRDKRFQDATIRFENASSGMPKAFDAAGLEEYRKLALGLVPKEATEVVPEREVPDAVEINDWKGFEAFYSYNFFGRKFMRSILFLKLDGEREIRVTIDAKPGDFEQMHEAFVMSLPSWHEKAN